MMTIHFRVGVTGATGKLGSELVKLGAIPIEGDITNEDEIRAAIIEAAPNIIVHCAGISDPDICEKNQERTYAVNLRGFSNVSACEVPTILISTDHVFDGKRGNYREMDRLNPVNVYGFSKFGAEKVAEADHQRVIRISSGLPLKRLTQFIENPGVVNPPVFFRRSYAHISHIAKGIWYYIEHWNDMPEVLHIAGTEILSEYELYLMACSLYGIDKRYVEPRRKELDGFAPRPRKAGLNVNLARKLGVPLFSALDGLKLK